LFENTLMSQTAEWSTGIKPWILRHVESDSSLDKLTKRIMARGGSPSTVAVYVKEVLYFCRWMEKEPDEAIATKQDWPRLVNDYIDYLIAEKKLATSVGSRVYAAIKKWLDVNGTLSARDSAWGAVELPKLRRVVMDQLPTKPELRRILGAGDLAEKSLALVGLSSGMRIGSILALKVKDVDLERKIPVISPAAETTKNRRSFVTFCTPECKEVLLQYLKDRERRGEKVGPESYLIATERPLGAPITSVSSGDKRWMNMVTRSGLAKKGKYWDRFHFHVLRKYFKSWTSMSGVSSVVVEYLMGHRSGLEQVYFLPSNVEKLPEEIIARLQAEYEKAIPALSAMSEDERIAKLELSVEQKATDLAAKEGMIDELRSRLTAIESALLEKKVSVTP